VREKADPAMKKAQFVAGTTGKLSEDVRAVFSPRPKGFAEDEKRRRHLRSPYIKYGFACFLAVFHLLQTEPRIIYES
jgi:hypothetical protein